MTTIADTTTGGPACALLDEDCAADFPCCSPCMTCTAGTCLAAAPETGSAACGGACFTCGVDGECAPLAIDTACMGNCNQLVWQAKDDGTTTSCFGYADLVVPSTCDAVGQCRPPTMLACPDPALMPGTEKLLAACDTVCVADPGLCSIASPASAVTTDNFCVVNAESPGCSDACTSDPDTMQPAEIDATCDAAGVCQRPISNCTGGLICSEATKQCLTKCMNDSDCVGGNCMNSQCV